MSVHMSIHLSVHMYMYMSVPMSTHLSVHMYMYMSVPMPTEMSLGCVLKKKDVFRKKRLGSSCLPFYCSTFCVRRPVSPTIRAAAFAGHNYMGHNYLGHNYLGHDYVPAAASVRGGRGCSARRARSCGRSSARNTCGRGSRARTESSGGSRTS